MPMAPMSSVLPPPKVGDWLPLKLERFQELLGVL